MTMFTPGTPLPSIGEMTFPETTRSCKNAVAGQAETAVFIKNNASQQHKPLVLIRIILFIAFS
jgi:hypothetical protein